MLGRGGSTDVVFQPIFSTGVGLSGKSDVSIADAGSISTAGGGGFTNEANGMYM